MRTVAHSARSDRIKGRTEALRRAVRRLRFRVPVTRPEFDRLSARNKARAFTVAYMAKAKMIAKVHDALVEVMDKGGVLQDVFDRVREDVGERAGWTGENPWHLALVFRQNLNMAFSAGEHDAAGKVGAVAWEYRTQEDSSVRPTHAVLHGKRFKLSDKMFWPPWEFNCRCFHLLLWPEDVEGGGGVRDSADVEGRVHHVPAEVLDRGYSGPRRVRVTRGDDFRFDPTTYFQPLIGISKDIRELPDELARKVFIQSIKQNNVERFYRRSDFRRLMGANKIPVSAAYPAFDEFADNTFGKYQLPSGDFTPERRALHRTILQTLTKGVRVQGRRKTVWMMGGGTASGKSSTVKHGFVELPSHREAVTVDADEIKSLLPENTIMKEEGQMDGAARVHEESSQLSKSLIARAMDRQMSIVLDGINGGRVEKVLRRVSGFKRVGYRVHANYVTVDVDKAIERSAGRASRQFDRSNVPEEVIRAGHRTVSEVFPALLDSGLLDSGRLYDTNDGGVPVLVVSQEAGGRVVVHDQERWDRFLRKAGE